MSEYMHDEFGPCAPGDEQKPAKLAEEKPKIAVAAEVSRMVPDAEFAQDVMKRVKAAMNEHVFPMFEDASRRGLIITWDSVGRAGHMARWQINGIRVLKMFEPQ